MTTEGTMPLVTDQTDTRERALPQADAHTLSAQNLRLAYEKL